MLVYRGPEIHSKGQLFPLVPGVAYEVKPAVITGSQFVVDVFQKTLKHTSTLYSQRRTLRYHSLEEMFKEWESLP